ncbi:hypothetical protein M378DRAFT_288506 [Amanita muscaria Koide BX008]|uniref:Uncharacterized protein n=1 Tax=Amanita muscaria (strain Koide BX008) TaxID=946122 RepID=A0A0C2SXT4_AMAMK|nr:hypothetical protein M378DRAFT_288506 [Amanita muscaria Koide BX008]
MAIIRHFEQTRKMITCVVVFLHCHWWSVSFGILITTGLLQHKVKMFCMISRGRSSIDMSLLEVVSQILTNKFFHILELWKARAKRASQRGFKLTLYLCDACDYGIKRANFETSVDYQWLVLRWT